MPGGEKLSRGQERAIAALLQAPTIEKAVPASGVSERTLRGWLKLPEFQAAYRQARREVVEVAIGKLQQVTAQAVEKLQALLDAPSPTVQLGAAKAVLDYARQAIELTDLVEKVEELKRQIEELKHGGRDTAPGGGEDPDGGTAEGGGDGPSGPGPAPGGPGAPDGGRGLDAGRLAEEPSVLEFPQDPLAL
jgi:hypothetical protein